MANANTKKKIEDEQASALTDVRLYARKIWLAGLGAYARVNEEGSQYVKELIKAGEETEKDVRKTVDAQSLPPTARSIRSKAKCRLPRGVSRLDSTESRALSTVASQRP